MKNSESLSRRKFIRNVIGGAVATGIASKFGSFDAFANPAQDSAPLLPSRPLGKTGHNVSLLGLGGQATLEEENRKDDAVAIINRAIDLGVNYLDTSPIYGPSELYLGEVMKSRRKEVFLASKTLDRSYDGSMRLLEKSFKRLQTDHLNLWQLHNVRTQNDLDFIFSKQGALKALVEAKEQGVVGNIGITGHHDPVILRNAIERQPFDTILMAMNAADRHKDSFVDEILPIAVKKEMGIIAMKVVARGKIFKEGGVTTMEQALRYVLSQPISNAIVGIGTIKELEENVQIVKNFKPYKSDEMAQLETLTKPYYADATWYKTLW